MERDFDLAGDANAFFPREGERPGGRRHARAGNDETGAFQPLQVVTANVNHDTLCAQLLGAAASIGRRSYIGCINVVAVLFQQHRRGATTASEPDYGDLAPRRHELPRAHRNFNVLSAMKANRMPMIQKRTTTCASSQPLISK